MKRILVTGNAGAGKTTLAAFLGDALEFPVFNLDRIVWQEGWRKTPPDQRAKKIAELIRSSDQWIIEGVSSAVMEAADTVIFLDVARHVCLWRCLKRNRHYLFRSRPDLPDGCPELLIIPELLRIVWQFPGSVRPSILKHLDDNKDTKTVCVVRDNAGLKELLNTVCRRGAACGTAVRP